MPKITENTTVAAIANLPTWILSQLAGWAGAALLTAAAVYVGVLSFDESASEGLRAVIFFLLPVLWGSVAAVRNRNKSTTRGRFDQIGTWAIPALGVIAGIVASLGLVLDAPVSTTNIALGVMVAFWFMIQDAADSDGRDDQWLISLLLMVTVIALTAAATA